MRLVTFPGYGVNSVEVTIVCERILCWSGINYNGNHGTEIQLDSGKSVRVSAFPSDVKRAIEASFNPS